MTGHSDEHWMRKAIELARTKGSDPSCTPIAAIIVLEDQILGASVNETAQRNDATAHAEILAIRAAGAKLEDMELRDATLYSTLQPCGMCTMGSIWSKIARIVYGAGRADVHKMYFEDRHLDTADFIRDAFRDDLEITGGILSEECARLYYGPDDDVPEARQGNI